MLYFVQYYEALSVRISKALNPQLSHCLNFKKVFVFYIDIYFSVPMELMEDTVQESVRAPEESMLFGARYTAAQNKRARIVREYFS